MITTSARRSLALLMLASTAAIPLAGCDMLEHQTGMSHSAAQGVVGGAAFGGIIALLAHANPAWVAASIVLGGAAGGLIGDKLGKEDATTHAEHNLHALDTLAEGQTESWSNPDFGNNGSTTVHSVRRESNGNVCKTYTETVHTESQNVTRDGRACKAPGGNWTVATG